MNLNKEYQQIKLPVTKNEYDLSVLSNKVVDKVTFTKDSWDNSLNELIIIFTDKTFIAITIDEDRDGRLYLDNSYIGEPTVWNNGKLPHRMYNKELHFDPFIQNRIDCGLWNVTKEEVLKIIEDDNKIREDNEYRQYLRLKEKFENAK